MAAPAANHNRKKEVILVSSGGHLLKTLFSAQTSTVQVMSRWQCSMNRSSRDLEHAFTIQELQRVPPCLLLLEVNDDLVLQKFVIHIPFCECLQSHR